MGQSPPPPASPTTGGMCCPTLPLAAGEAGDLCCPPARAMREPGCAGQPALTCACMLLCLRMPSKHAGRTPHHAPFALPLCPSPLPEGPTTPARTCPIMTTASRSAACRLAHMTRPPGSPSRQTARLQLALPPTAYPTRCQVSACAGRAQQPAVRHARQGLSVAVSQSGRCGWYKSPGLLTGSNCARAT